MDSKVHTRSTGSAPAAPLAYLARSYLEETEHLEERLGGYASFWRFCAERLIGFQPAEEHPYPLWEPRLGKRGQVPGRSDSRADHYRPHASRDRVTGGCINPNCPKHSWAILYPSYVL